jgi:uncharacterized protein
MKISIIGATGYTGSAMLSESINRGHEVTALSRNPDRVTPAENLSVQTIDVVDTERLASALASHNVVISAFNPGTDSTGLGVQSIIAAVKLANVPRLVVVGGAGSLEVAPGQRLIDQPDFPSEWKEGASKTAAFLDLLKEESELNWTFLSPAANLVPGERTGNYRSGGNTLITDESGDSRISVQDLAVAMLDEIEQPKHAGKRFTVAY